MRYLGPAILVIAGVLLNFVDVDLPIADTQVLGIVLILAGLVWGVLEVLRQTGAPGDAGGREEERRE
jgi:F0F1-type ATP synthase assembly protein I